MRRSRPMPPDGVVGLLLLVFVTSCLDPERSAPAAPLEPRHRGELPRFLLHETRPPDRDGATASEAGCSEDAAGDESAGAESTAGESWSVESKSAVECESSEVVGRADDPYGPRRQYGYHGYAVRSIEVARLIDGHMRRHCVRVAYPTGPKTAAGNPTRIGELIDSSWFRLIETTLQRIPWTHLQEVRTVVIDDRPILHGVASFDRRDPARDARDGHTVWLRDHLFQRSNHWADGNYGTYWAYHVQYDDTVVDGQSSDHDLFSPVLLHEIGHIVNYNVVNRDASDPTCPPCAWMCGDTRNCDRMTDARREAPCVTAYCTGFGHASGTENWAEMYRWYYQSEETRALLARHFPACWALLEMLNAGLRAPWARGLGQAPTYRKTRWKSCGQKPCREF